MLNWLPARSGYFLGFTVCAAVLSGAFFLEYAMGLEPCPLCMLQRVVVAAMGIVFLVAALHGPRRLGAWLYGIVQLLLGGTGIGLALRHLWIQSLPADQVPACGMGFSYMFETLPLFQVIERTLKGSGECAHVDLVLGLSIPAWTLALFMVLVAWSLLLAARTRR